MFHDTTDVVFLPLGDADIERYLEVANPLDKAGAYGIQESGGLIIREISGSYENVMGLPVAMVLDALEIHKSDCESARDGR